VLASHSGYPGFHWRICATDSSHGDAGVSCWLPDAAHCYGQQKLGPGTAHAIEGCWVTTSEPGRVGILGKKIYLIRFTLLHWTSLSSYLEHGCEAAGTAFLLWAWGRFSEWWWENLEEGLSTWHPTDADLSSLDCFPHAPHHDREKQTHILTPILLFGFFFWFSVVKFNF
jgi:hypothetical protein